MKHELTNIGLGILSWRGYETLTASLESYVKNSFLELFEERVIYFNEIDGEAQNIAKHYGFQARGTEKNEGIYGGFKGLAENMNSKYILLVENDQPLIVSGNEARQQLEHGINFLKSKDADVVQYRSLRYPGDAAANIKHFHRFYPAEDAPMWRRVLSGLLRVVHPRGARRRLANSPFHLERPEQKFSQIRRDEKTNFLFMSSKYRKWSNQPFLLERDFFENKLLEHVGNAATRRRVNNFKNIEIELNSVWWWNQNFKVAMAPGIFTHKRIGHRGY